MTTATVHNPDSLEIHGMHAVFDMTKRRWCIVTRYGRTVRRFNHLGVGATWMSKHPEYAGPRQRVGVTRSTISKQYRAKQKLDKTLPGGRR